MDRCSLTFNPRPRYEMSMKLYENRQLNNLGGWTHLRWATFKEHPASQDVLKEILNLNKNKYSQIKLQERIHDRTSFGQGLQYEILLFLFIT